MKSIAIIGTGPAGLMAAQAVALHGHPFSLFSAPTPTGVQKSVIGGAQFLHRAVPTISDEDAPDMMIRYRKRGTSEGYKKKVYGAGEVPFVSFDNVQDGEEVPAWHLHSVYDQMWDGICGPRGHSVNALRVTPETLTEWLEKQLWELIICTLPRPSVCRTHAGQAGPDQRAHGFWSQTIHVCDEPMGAGFNEVLYNGDPEQSWYRSSNIGGNESTEWGERYPNYFKSRIRPIQKPISHDCTCWDGEPILFAGRYGEWRKGVLVHDAFVSTWKALEDLK